MTFVVKQAAPEHAPDLLEIARTVHFINLPPFADVIERMIGRSRASFDVLLSNESPPPDDVRSDRRYMFVLEAMDGAPGPRVIGTSAIIAGMGDESDPNLSYQLVRVRRRSEDLAKQDDELRETGLDYVTGEVEHIVAQLYRDKSSPTELGGLIVRKEYRGRRHGAQDLPGAPTPGRVLSFVRFHFIARFRAWFSRVLIAEMMAHLEPYNDGNPFWRHFMRRFINLPYEKADRLSTRRREFMYRLLPDRVYVSLLPDAVIATLGTVDKDTERARRLLEEVGFRYTQRIDPFDAGPHMESWTEEVALVRETVRRRVTRIMPIDKTGDASACIISADSSMERFLAVAGAVRPEGEGVAIDVRAAEAIGVSENDNVWTTPLNPTPEEHEDFEVPLIDLPALDDEHYDRLLNEAYARHSVGEPGRGPGPTGAS